MTFTPCELDPDDPMNVQAWQSETGRWRITVDRVAFGYRVQTRCYHYPGELAGVTLPYCAGPDRSWVEALVTVLERALAHFPESLTENQMQAAFPWYERRPMANDPVCWGRLCQLAGIDPATPIDDIGEHAFDVQQAYCVQLYLTLRLNQKPEADAWQVLGRTPRTIAWTTA